MIQTDAVFIPKPSKYSARYTQNVLQEHSAGSYRQHPWHDIHPTRCCCLFFLFYLSLPAAGSPSVLEGPRNLEAIRAVQVFEPHTSIPRSRERGTCSFGTGRFVITYPMLRPPGPARRCNQNEWFENSITLITSIKVSIRRGCFLTLRFPRGTFALTWGPTEDFPIARV